jgi:hypothetical protein
LSPTLTPTFFVIRSPKASFSRWAAWARVSPPTFRPAAVTPGRISFSAGAGVGVWDCACAANPHTAIAEAVVQHARARRMAEM